MLSFCNSVFAQGLINNGARIVFSGAAQIYVAGGTNGDYLSQVGGQIDPSATGIVTIEGDWTNNSANTGFGSDNGTVILNGAAESINGTSSTTFYNLTLAGTVGSTKTQNVNTSVGGVTTTNGVLSVGSDIYNLNSNILTITNPAITAVTYGTGYVLSETNLGTNPSIMRWNMSTITGAHVYPFGVAGTQIPFTFNKTTATTSTIDVSTRATAASNNLPWESSVSFMYCPNNASSGNNCAIGSVIDRWWQVNNNGAVTANLIFTYRGSENTMTISPTGLVGPQWWNGAGWLLDNSNNASASGVLAGTGTANLNGATTFGPFVLTSNLVPLPIELLDFSATCKDNNSVILNWTSASERNSSHFDIMNSSDGINFNKIATVNGYENSSSINKYSYTVLNKTELGNYFRLKMVDADLTSQNSKIEFVSNDCNLKVETPTVYYNQQNGIVITSTSKNATNYTVNIIDAAGRLIRSNSLPIKEGYNSITINPELANGVYLVNLFYTNGQVVSKKIPVINNN
ncbi:MAG: T9SS type A sorting domain-containing protein [Bacteroidota bacterium]|nr:T9SS type A sorting domain-containing protein [Bacteroidota bacterium]